jgi:hypothetical protein
VVAALVAGIVYLEFWHFHLVACSGGDVAAVVPNGVIDFAFEAATKDGLKLAL